MNSKPVIALAGAIAISAIGLAGGLNGSPPGRQAATGQPTAAQPPTSSTSSTSLGAHRPASRKPARPAWAGWAGPGPVRLVIPQPPGAGGPGLASPAAGV